MNTTHTPGPWTVSDREIYGPSDSGIIVARLPEWGVLADNPDPAAANARLISAAPDLLAAAIDALETFERRFPDSPTAHDLRAAIAKAMGV